jgi:hypothetical protein
MSLPCPLCALHHHDLHMKGNEGEWWRGRGIEPLPVAESLWRQSRGLPDAPEAGNADPPGRRRHAARVMGDGPISCNPPGSAPQTSCGGRLGCLPEAAGSKGAHSAKAALDVIPDVRRPARSALCAAIHERSTDNFGLVALLARVMRARPYRGQFREPEVIFSGKTSDESVSF